MRWFLLTLCLCFWLACSDDGDPTPADAGAADLAVVKDGSGPDAAPPDLPSPDAPGPYACKAGAKAGKVGKSDGELTQGSVKYNVRVPTGYSSTAGSPLIVVYAAAGGNPQNMEQFTGLTADAGARGYIVAYVDHVSPNNLSGVQDIAQVPAEISKKWCVDPAHVYLTGHSNGGSVIYLMLARGNWSSLYPAAIAPSAAGLSKQTFASFTCPKTSPPVMVLHSKNDGLFPGYGRDARDWWVGCKACSKTAKTAKSGCLAYTGCSDGSEVHYCETSGSHGQWPKLNKELLDFFAMYRKR